MQRYRYISIWINDVYFRQIEAVDQQQIERSSQTTILNSPSFLNKLEHLNWAMWGWTANGNSQKMLEGVYIYLLQATGILPVFLLLTVATASNYRILDAR